MKHLFALCSVIIICAACGMSAEQKAALAREEQKLMEDSIKKSTESIIQRTIQLKDSLEFYREDLILLESKKSTLLGDLHVQHAKLNEIKGFVLGRLPETKEKQIRDQTAVLETIEKEIKYVDERMLSANSYIKIFERKLSELANKL